MIESLLPIVLIANFGVNLVAEASSKWIAAKWRTAGVTNHDLQKALRESYCDALSSIEFGFRRREGLLDSLGKRRLYREITARFDKEFLTPFISETSLSQDELESLAREGAKYCRILREAVDLLLPKEDVPNITIENLLLTGRKLEGADDLRKLNDKAKADLRTKVRSVEGIPKFFFDFLDYKDLLMGSMVFFYGERIKADERVRSILTHAELQKIREEQSKQYQKQAAKLETALQSQMSAFQQFLSPIKDNFAEVLTCLERLEAEWAETTRYLQRILDLISLDKGLSDKDKRQLEAGLSPSFDLHAKYEFDERKPIGYGAIATVYRALHRGLRQVRAVKVLKPEHRENQEVVERFLREAVVLGSLKHANIVQIYDAGGGGPNLDFYLEMEYVEGLTLRNFIKTHEFDWQRILKFIKQLGSAIQTMHESGIIHRDLNPRNIMIDKNGDLKVMDFGVAKIIGVEGLTKDGQVVGTTDYIAPEQARGERVDERADIYSFGVILYELYTRRLPSIPLLPLRQYQPSVPEWLEGVVAKCLKPERGLRYSSMKELLAVIDAEERRAAAPAPAPARCALHPQKDAVGECTICGKKVCNDCCDVLKGKNYCRQCAKKVLEISPLAPPKAPVEAIKPVPAPVLSVDTARINLADVRVGSRTTKSFTVRNTGTGRLTGRITTSHPWLKAMPMTVDSERFKQEIQVTADASYLNDGISVEGLINIATNGGTAQVTVRLSTRTATKPAETKRPVPEKRARPRRRLLLAVIIVAILGLMVPAVIFGINTASKPPSGDNVPANIPASVAPPSAAPVPKGTGRIAFLSGSDDPVTYSGRGEFYVMNADGTNLSRVAFARVYARTVLSPDCSRVVSLDEYLGEIKIVLVGSEDIVLKTGFQYLCCPAWSPDGTRIAFGGRFTGSDKTPLVGYEDYEDSEVYIMDYQGSQPQQISKATGSVIDPAWSPDGTKVAFISNSGVSGEILVVNADGSDQRTLTKMNYKLGRPTWSPDGTKVAFLAKSDPYVVNTDGSRLIQLNRQLRLMDADYLAWSPDGTKIALSDPFDDKIIITTADGGEIIDLGILGTHPCWSPDGTMIAFGGYNGNGIYVMNSDGTNLTRLTTNDTNIEIPLFWLPR